MDYEMAYDFLWKMGLFGVTRSRKKSGLAPHGAFISHPQFYDLSRPDVKSLFQWWADNGNDLFKYYDEAQTGEAIAYGAKDLELPK